ncbi:hypothetical protein ACTI_29080 [Actinoplanes sp. OR16]|uniref:hypothetical protein n=1 Tax=Actinoplanes sp. OR16 TaxID=946334 RepID=UPI000F71CF65|nr:hypothetical protein [Actinoplanes sp. OR16]BBH66223.1 hypothetical protein ACTI_29080 [Actinoplanes sp. OR16]
MRHLRSILYALVLAPSIWILAGVGFTHDLTSRGREFFAEESIAGLLLLIFSGILYAILTFAPVSPAGPVLAGVAYLGVTIWAWTSPEAYAGLWAPEISKDTFDLSRPGYGLAALLAIPLIGTALSARRWARYEPPVLPIIGEIGRFRGKASVAGAAPLSIAETTVIRPATTPATLARPAATTPATDRTVAIPGTANPGAATPNAATPNADRTVAVPNADRTVAVPNADRTVSFPTNDRTVAFPVNDRTAAVPASDATVAITAPTSPAAAGPTVAAPREDTTMLFPAATGDKPQASAEQAGDQTTVLSAIKPADDEETHRLSRGDVTPSTPAAPPAALKPAAAAPPAAPKPASAAPPAALRPAAAPAAPKPPAAAPAAPKPAELRAAEPKPADAKPAESTPADAKPTESRPAESKPAESKVAEAQTVLIPAQRSAPAAES